MSSTARLILTFASAAGEDVKFSYSHANTEAQEADVQALAAGLIANGSIFQVPPVTAKSAKIIITTEEDISLNS